MSLFSRIRNAIGKSSESDSGRRRHYIFEVPFDELTDDSVVCTCAQIKYRDIKQEIEFGFTTADEILEDLEAGDACRKCMNYLNRLIDHAKQDMGI